jgi:hypothetical protein
VKPLIQPDQEEQPKEDAAKSQVLPDSQEKSVEDASKPLIKPDQEEQPTKGTAIGWMKNVWKNITR